MLRGKLYDRYDPAQQKKARKQTKTDEKSLDDKRQDYQHSGNELHDIITAMIAEQAKAMKLRKLIRELVPSDTRARADDARALQSQLAETEDNHQAMFNMASLKGLLVLQNGFALLADMLSVQEKVEEGEYARVSVAETMFDLTAMSQRFLPRIDRRIRLTNQIVEALGVSQKFWNKGAYIPYRNGIEIDESDEDAEDAEDDVNPAAGGEGILAVEEGIPATAGVPQEDLQKAALNREKIIKMVRGETPERSDNAGDPKP